MSFDVAMTARAERDLRGLSDALQKRAAEVLRRLAAGDVTLKRKKLIDRPETRVRLGDLRVFYTQEGTTIVIRRLADRKDAYR
ncbi:MAG: type II toxin-antitoxin system RelE/ParE family toxin [Candidatus Eremiobacteraeota bacterium]|nr:type II toxin-antitoxin system RelE/ParE family toxin [Candidatus Eremiobacteraeota bacterium]